MPLWMRRRALLLLLEGGMTLSVWIVTREKGNGRNRAVIGVYRHEQEAKDRVAAEEQKDPKMQWDFDTEEWDVIGEEQKVYVVVQPDEVDGVNDLHYVGVEHEGGSPFTHSETTQHPLDVSLLRIGPFERAA